MIRVERSNNDKIPYNGSTKDVDLGSHIIKAGSIVASGGTSSQFLKADGSLDSNTYSTSGGLSTETSSRVSVDTSLSTGLSTESSSRVSVDTSLSTVITIGLSTEISTRTLGDSSLSTVVSNGLSTEISTRTSSDVSLTNGLSTESSTRISGDGSLSTGLSTEISSRVLLSTGLSTEISSRISGDSSLSTYISTESSTRTSNVTSLSTGISTEISSRTSGDSSLSTVISSEISIRTSFDSSLSTNISTNYYPLTAVVDEKGHSGFVDGNNISVSYNWTNRTITLTGTDLSYYFRGVKHTLVSPWTSSAHTDTVGIWFLSTVDGTNFTWSQTVWSFSDVMVSYVNYQSTSPTSFAIKETHGTMDWKSHEEFHSQIGTYLLSGGKLTVGTYLENSPLNTSTTPGFDVAVIKDEDCQTTLSVWSDGTYTTMSVIGSTSSTFNVSATFPFISTGSFIQVNNTTTGVMTNGVSNRWYNIYQILMPTSNDTDSSKYRMIMLQPQTTFTSLASAQAEDVNTLRLGSLNSLSPEFVIYARITYVTANGDNNTGKCRIATGGVTYVTGNKMSQVSIAGVAGTNHVALSNLTWLNSGHIGTINTIPAFDGSGNATEITTSTIATSSQLSTEISTRVSVDTSLSTVVSSETSSRISGDASLSTLIESTSTTSLSTVVSSETSSRISGDASLSTLINSISTTSLSTVVSTETSLRISGDASLSVAMILLSNTVYYNLTVSNSPTNLYTLTSNNGNCMLITYTVVNNSNTAQRSGSIVCSYNTTSISYTETATSDLGTSTSNVRIIPTISGGYLYVQSVISGIDTWTIKVNTKYF